MGEELTKDGKIMTYQEFSTRRELVKEMNRLGIAREDVTSIFPSEEGYTVIYYYAGKRKTSNE